MRYSVIVSDAVFLLPAAYAVARAWHASERVRSRTRTRTRRGGGARATRRRVAWAFATFATSPAQILVDHGHFQYNGISLGLTMYAVAAVLRDRDVLGSILFACALNHKQMSAYFAPAFFAHLLGKCLSRARNPSARARAAAVARLGAAVVGTFVIVWAPFFLAVDPKTHTKDGWEGVLRVLARLAPLERGLYEDYVANFWCATNPLFRWRRMATRAAAQAALAATVAAIAPPWRTRSRTLRTRGSCGACSTARRVFSCSVSGAREVGAAPASPGARLGARRPGPRRVVPDRGVALDVAAAPEGRAARRVRRDGARVRRARGRGGAGRRGERGDERAFGRSRASKPNEATNIRARWNSFAARALATRARRDVRRSGGAALAGTLRAASGAVPVPARPAGHVLLLRSVRRRRRVRQPQATRSRGERSPPANPESAARATRASRRTASAAATEWSLVRLAATPEPKTTRPAHGDQEKKRRGAMKVLLVQVHRARVRVSSRARRRIVFPACLTLSPRTTFQDVRKRLSSRPLSPRRRRRVGRSRAGTGTRFTERPSCATLSRRRCDDAPFLVFSSQSLRIPISSPPPTPPRRPRGSRPRSRCRRARTCDPRSRGTARRLVPG